MGKLEGSRDQSITILESVVGPGRTVKYIDQVVRHAPGNVDFIYFSWVRAFFRRYDVFHVHWPEFLLRDKAKVRGVMKQALFSILLSVLRLRGVPIVRTVHNLDPHGRLSASQQRLLSRLDGETALFVKLNRCTAVPAGAKSVVIPHGDYREQFRKLPSVETEPGRWLSIGRLEPYKGVDRLIEAVKVAGRTGESLRIVGSASQAMQQSLLASLRGWSREDVEVSTLFEFVSDADMASEIGRAECVVLPYTEMLNSGIALVALSLNTPIVVPQGCVNDELAAECGPGWVIRYEGEFTPATLDEMREQLRGPRSDSPNLRGRDWPSVARSYADAFKQVAQIE
ncbi:glycosyltransferase [Microbacterium sp. P05]|uniref:glycosyltransferase n=1 Tax=Microbacterium sp. P05 TaxID=3366948 RepID=UPI003744D9BE